MSEKKFLSFQPILINVIHKQNFCLQEYKVKFSKVKNSEVLKCVKMSISLDVQYMTYRHKASFDMLFYIYVMQHANTRLFSLKF